MKKRLDERLLAIVSMVKDSKMCADIGTDHALIPCELIKSGRAQRCVATDIKDGPVRRAEDKIRQEGLGKKIKVIKGDGIEPALRYKPDTVIVAGMGGELIAELLFRVKKKTVKEVIFILQPMSKATELRVFLAKEGFTVVDERITKKSSGRLFQIIAVKYDGEKRKITRLEATIGKKNIERADDSTRSLAGYEIYRLLKKHEGLKKADIEPDGAEVKLISSLASVIEKCKESENED